MKFKNYLLVLSIVIYSSIIGQNYNFKRFSVEEGLAEPGLYCLEEDSKGELWVGLENGGIAIFDGTSFRPFRTKVNIGKNIRSIFKSSTDEMWIGSTYEGISIVGEDFVKKITIENGMPSNHIRSFIEDFEGRIWAGTIGGGVAIFDDEKLVSIINEQEGLISNNVKSLLAKSDGDVWVGTSRGISIYAGLKLKSELTLKTGLVSDEILSLAEDKSGNVWIGTSKGLSVYVGDSIINIGVNDGLEQARIKSVLVDKDHQVWVGTRLGVGKIEVKDLLSRQFKITWFNKTNGLSNNRVRCLYEDRSGAIWIGTYFGGINTLFNESFCLYNQTHGLTDDAVSVLQENLSDSSIWLGIYGGGLNVLKSGEIKTISTGQGLSSDYINAIVHLDNLVSVVATDEGINLVRNREVVEVWDSYNGYFEYNKITDLVSCDNICIGLTADHELFAFKIEEGFVYDSVLTNEIIKNIDQHVNALYYVNSKFWFVTDAFVYEAEVLNGVIKFVKKWEIKGVESLVSGGEAVLGYTSENLVFTFNKKISILETIPKTKQIRFIVRDMNNAIWLGIDHIIHRILWSNNKIVSRKTYGFNEGFIGMQSFENAAIVSHDNQLWIGTIKGLLKIEDEIYKGVKRDLKVYFSGLYSGNDALDLNKYSKKIENGNPIGLELPYNMNQLNFKAQAFHLKNSNEVEFKYELSGDEDLTAYGGADNIIFNLKPGEYQLNISAKTQWGTWSSDPLQIVFSITQPFWYKPSFIISVVFIIIMIVFLTLNYRTRKLEREKAQLEVLIFERTEQLVVEQEKSEELLLNILPRGIAKELKENGTASTRKYKNASVLFTDFKGFTSLSATIDPIELVECLDKIFGEFDRVIEENHLEKIKTIGDAYMCASGIPKENEAHAFNIVKAALQLVEVMRIFNQERRLLHKVEWPVRVGIHSGELIAGVVGKKKFAYDIWGDTVNIASRMESNSEPGKVNVSRATYELIKADFATEYRGEIEAKNRGKLEMYFVSEKV